MAKSILMISFLLSVCCSGQKISAGNFDENYDLLLEHLDNENWEASEKLTRKLLDFAEPAENMEIEKMVLRYIYIYSTAGLLNDRKLNKEKALKNVEFLKSKEMIMPARLYNSKCYVNCIQITEEEPDTFYTGVNNAAGTYIFSFEYVKISDGIKESKSDLEGKYLKLKGTLNEISVEGYALPRFRLRFINGDYLILDR